MKTKTKAYYRNYVFTIKGDVYEPREDSFLIADCILKLGKENQLDGRAIDIGTGCGIQAILLSKFCEEVWASDIDPLALKLARENASHYNLPIRFVKSDLFSGIPQKFDVVVFNPPYLPSGSVGGRSEEISWNGGATGRSVIDRFLKQLSNHLKNHFRLLIVQSTLSKPEKTLDVLKERFDARIIAEKKLDWEKLVVIYGKK